MEIIKIGDAVLVNDQDHSRTLWKLAMVKELLKYSDGQIRGALVQIGITRSTLRQPLQALYPLENRA